MGIRMGDCRGRVYRAAIVLAAMLCGCIVLIGCAKGQPSEQISETRLLMSTVCTITINGTDDEQLLDDAFELCQQLESLFSMTDERSDVWRVNHAEGKPVQVAPETAQLVLRGIEFGELSGGMFEITIGRLSRLWNFGGENPSVPSAHELGEAQLTADYRQVSVSENILQLDNPQAWLDLGAIAKGYIADKVASLLQSRGVESAMINLGGDVVVVGNRIDGSPWRLGIRKPFSDGELVGAIEVTGVAVMSSGVYERQFEENGRLYHHILDPFTGMPVQSDVISATVITDDAVTGEGLSTIAVLLGSERAEAIFERTDGFIGAVLILESGEVLTVGDVRIAELGMRN